MEYVTQRNASTEFLTEIAKASVRPVHLFASDWGSQGWVRLTDNSHALDYDGYSYTAGGSLLEFDTVEEVSELQVTGCNLSLSGVSDELIAIVETQTTLVNIPVTIYRGMLTSSGGLVADPIILFQGITDGASLEENPDSGTAAITLRMTNHFSDFDKVSGRRTNDSEQQALYPGDKGFSFVATLMEKVIRW